MKALNEMNNREKAYVLAKLFPKSLKDLTEFVKQETERFRGNEEYIRSIWVDKTLITADFWYSLVENTERLIDHFGLTLHKSLRVFSDHLFDGHNAIFLTNCMIEYADREECDPKLRQAIHLFFGENKMLLFIADTNAEVDR